MMRIQELADLLVEWAAQVLPELKGTYDHAAEERTEPLPDVAVEYQDVEVVRDSADLFPEWSVQQVDFIRIHTVSMLLVVDPDPAQAASDTLADFVDRLTDSLMGDQSAGGRLPPVAQVSQQVRATFNPPFVTFDDNSQGRQVTLELRVGEFINTEE